MIPTREEIGRSLGGAWALFLNRREGMQAFDVSIDGFFRSFGAIFLLLPPYAISVLAEARLLQVGGAASVEAFPMGWFFAWKMLGLAIDWIALPVVLVILARPLGFGPRYIPFVVARNWASPISLSLSVLPAILFASGLVGQEFAAILFLIVIVVVVRYQYLITRIALELAIAPTIGIVVLDLLLSLVIGESVNRMAGF
ncbi:hypothetical protein [Amorphus orientalis]|uniref:Uncharacterized protein n=1 Tax=Amorphus orientalis TaxID=649198 RepID=A0AAE4ATW3_9HYPH|nr:hypothetical protein [Amorphus orientalis]MDQ0316650.1 hypothetical protein [Amorphus orientalis]